ncbi:SDR family NAD(P)-dependent oxidoreductase [Geodermatophilus sp. SYSU D00079]
MQHLVVVGAGPGIAAATARRFGGRGYAVGLIARRDEALAELQSDLAGVLAGRAPADAADPASLSAAVELLVDTFGPADVLLFNVSVGRQVTVPDLDPADLLADLAAGAVALQTAVRAVLPGMRERGSGTVLVTGSGAADRPVASMATLGVQKAALRALVDVQARALAPEGVHVATVTVRGLVGEDQQVHPDRVAALYEELVAETAGPREAWRTVVDLSP